MTTILNVGLWLVLVLLGYRGFRSCFMLKHWRCSIFDIEFFWHHLLLPVLSFLEKPLWYMCPDISLLRWSIRVTAFALFVRISEARKVTSWVLLPAWPGYVILLQTSVFSSQEWEWKSHLEKCCIQHNKYVLMVLSGVANTGANKWLGLWSSTLFCCYYWEQDSFAVIT